MSNKLKQAWISPTKDGEWKLKIVGNTKASFKEEFKKDLIPKAIDYAKKHGLELIGQKENGQINFKNSYGNDPESVKG